jgi:hypothetical protein
MGEWVNETEPFTHSAIHPFTIYLPHVLFYYADQGVEIKGLG